MFVNERPVVLHGEMVLLIPLESWCQESVENLGRNRWGGVNDLSRTCKGRRRIDRGIHWLAGRRGGSRGGRLFKQRDRECADRRMARDDSGYDEEAWASLKAELDRDRLSTRRLFDG